MKKRLVLALLFALACGYPQTSETQAQVSPGTAKIEKKLKELESLQQKALRAIKNSAGQNSEVMEKALAELRKVQEAISSTKNELQEKIEAAEREGQKRSDDQQRTQYVLGSVLFGAVLLCVLVILFVVRRSHQKTRRVVMMSSSMRGVEIGDTLIDPDVPAIKRALAHKKQQKFVFTIDGQQVDCVAELVGGEPFVTQMNGEAVQIRFENRKRSAAKRLCKKEANA